MKKIFTLALLLAAVSMFAQTDSKPFARKFLLEHFTSEQCKYCPYGIMCIEDLVAKDKDRYIWVSHHAGFYTDTYTIPESEEIEVYVNNDGAPMIALNRVRRSTSSWYSLSFNPTGMQGVVIDDDTYAETSVVIDCSYDVETRALEVTVHGETVSDASQYLLTVLVKENNLLGKQADAITGWKGAWREYVHTRAARKFLTASFGDTVQVADKNYSKTFVCTLDADWKAENCCVVAYLTPMAKQPVVNAEQVAVVEGTEGGEQYMSWGVTSNAAPANQEKLKFERLYTKRVSDTQVELMLVAAREDSVSSPYGGLNVVALLYLNTDSDALFADTLSIDGSEALNTYLAGYVNMDSARWEGSRLSYVWPPSLKENPNSDELVELYSWMMVSGKVGIDHAGNLLMAGNFSNKEHFTSRYTHTTSALDEVLAPMPNVRKLLKDGQVLIQTESGVYNILGVRL